MVLRGALLALLALGASALQFDLERNDCLFEEAAEGTTLYVTWKTVAVDDSDRGQVRVTARAENSRQEQYSGQGADGKFEVAVSEPEAYRICFAKMGAKDGVPAKAGAVRVDLEINHSAEEEAFTQLATHEDMLPVERHVTHISAMADAINTQMEQLMRQERRMRDYTEASNSRILYFSLFSIFVLVALGVGQLVYLKGFFKDKQLL